MGQVFHDGGESCRSLLKPRIYHRRVAGADHVVQLEVDKLQQRLVELQEGRHDPEVHVIWQHLQA